MNYVIEGPDGTGKSTLAALLSQRLKLPIIQGEGPPKSFAEFHDRVARYERYDNVIFDRHPCISEDIYGPIMGRGSILTFNERRNFFATNPFIIYVRPTTHELRDHQRHDHESVEHHARVAQYHKDICVAYDHAMLNMAHYIYHRTDTHIAHLLVAA